jgi:hypothetical protein
MPAYLGSTAVHRTVALALPFAALAWLMTVPVALTTWNFVTFVGVLTALAWVARTRARTGQPATPVARLVPEPTGRGPLAHLRGRS